MKNTRSLEIGTGLFVLLGFAALAFLTTQLPGTSLKLGGGPATYTVTAKFDNIGDLKAGSPVTMQVVGAPTDDKTEPSARAPMSDDNLPSAT